MKMYYISYRDDLFIFEEQVHLQHTFIISLCIHLHKVEKYLNKNSQGLILTELIFVQ
jgi:hypothetical protein